MVRLKEKYFKEIIPEMMRKFNCKNRNTVPKLEKIVINMGVGEANTNIKALDSAMKELALITGQCPTKTYAKKSIAAFKVKEGMPVGCRVTLRGDKMYEVLDRLINVALPRIRDFKGVNSSFDGQGNYTIGIKEQIIFPEINYDQIEKVRGMNISIVTTTNDDKKTLDLLSLFGLPFTRN
ncbi:50S ribosomal protein L5 [bacterium]|nr:50S ribosomal protein L5 [bacterium]MBU1153619.1 50S ribosomal protein L5 [bacterium]